MYNNLDILAYMFIMFDEKTLLKIVKRQGPVRVGSPVCKSLMGNYDVGLVKRSHSIFIFNLPTKGQPRHQSMYLTTVSMCNGQIWR